MSTIRTAALAAAGLTATATPSIAGTLPKGYSQIVIQGIDPSHADADGNIAGYFNDGQIRRPVLLDRGSLEPRMIDMSALDDLVEPYGWRPFRQTSPTIIGYDGGVLWGVIAESDSLGTYWRGATNAWSLWRSVDGAPAEHVPLPEDLQTTLAFLGATSDTLLGTFNHLFPFGADRTDRLYRLTFNGTDMSIERFGGQIEAWRAILGNSGSFAFEVSEFDPVLDRHYSVAEFFEGPEASLDASVAILPPLLDGTLRPWGIRADGALMLRGSLSADSGQPFLWTPSEGLYSPWIEDDANFYVTHVSSGGLWLGGYAKRSDPTQELSLWVPGADPVSFREILSLPRRDRNVVMLIDPGLIISTDWPGGGQTVISLPLSVKPGGLADIAGASHTGWSVSHPAVVADGRVDGRDLSEYVERWLNGSIDADVTQTNSQTWQWSYGRPDGRIDGADLSYFVETWLAEAY